MRSKEHQSKSANNMLKMPRVILFSGRTSKPCSTADVRAQTHAEQVIEDSASQADPDDIDDSDQEGCFRWLTSAGKLQVPKSKLPLETLMSGNRLGNLSVLCERT